MKTRFQAMCGLLSRWGVIFNCFLEQVGCHHADERQDERYCWIHPAQEFIGQHIPKSPRAQAIDRNKDGNEDCTPSKA